MVRVRAADYITGSAIRHLSAQTAELTATLPFRRSGFGRFCVRLRRAWKTFSF